ncbi:MAG: hypothetical protein ACI8TX_002408 [Hyphomicrobiaceae bacterium]
MSDDSKEQHEPAPVHSDIRFETQDVRYAPIAWVSVIGTLVTAGFCLAMYLVYGALAGHQASQSGVRNPLAAQFARTQPPAPRLQARPVEDLRKVHAREDAALSGYEWLNRSSGIVKIPIDRAMELYAASVAGETEK